MISLFTAQLWVNWENEREGGSLAIRIFRLWIQFGWGYSATRFHIDYYGKNHKWLFHIPDKGHINHYFKKIVRIS